MTISPYLKAILAALIAAGSYLTGVIVDGPVAQIVGTVLAGLIALAAVYQVPNAPRARGGQVPPGEF